MSEEYGEALQFIAIYNDLDKYMINIIGNSRKDTPYGYSQRVDRLCQDGNNVIASNCSLLKSYGELRNAIVHEYKGGEKIIAQPLIEEVLNFKKLVNLVKKPPIAFDHIVIRNEKIYKVKLDDNVSEVMKLMESKGYSYAPVIENAKLLGVFSQNTLFSHIANTSEFIFDENTLIKEFGSLIELDKHTCETFKFARKTATVFDIDLMFKDEAISEKMKL